MAILTISRQFGCGAEEIGAAIAKELGYEYVDRQKILDDMKQAGSQWEEKTKYFDENTPSVQERDDWSFLGFVALNQCIILSHAMKNNQVIIGRGANFLLKGVKHHLGIRIEAPMESRIEKVISRYSVNTENAKLLIDKADSEMAGAVYTLYGREWNDKREFTMSFDTNKNSPDEIKKNVMTALSEKDKLYSEESKNVIKLRLRAAEVKAGIATDPTFDSYHLSVSPKEEGMLQYGLVCKAGTYNHKDSSRLKEMAKKLAGDMPIDCDVRIRMQGRFSNR